MPIQPLTRRSFLVQAAAGGGFALGFHLPLNVSAQADAASTEINAWIVVHANDSVVIRVARSEMGQGVFTALPMLVAEELECDWAKVTAEFASPSDNLRRHRVYGDMSTGASRSVWGSQEMLRQAGAAAREMLIAAAAARWEVPVAECGAARGIITHRPSGRRLRYGAVAGDAARLPPPRNVTLKDRKNWTLIGTRQRRLEIKAKVTGQPIYASDLRLPGMVYASIVQSPVFGGTVRAVDGTKALAMKGVRQIVRQPDFVAVVADGWWQAHRAAQALDVTWDERGNGTLSSAAIDDLLREALSAPDPGVAHKVGDVAAGLRSAVTHIKADYAMPFLAHATMETPNCTAHVVDDHVEVWAPTQDGDLALATAADAAGVPRDRAVFHKTHLGGGFGRSGPVQDFIRQAVLIAKEVGRPVKLQWSREDDIRHDFYRPPAMARMTAGLDASGMPVAWQVRIAGQSLMTAFAPEVAGLGVEPVFLEAFVDMMPYAVPNLRVEYQIRNTPVPIGPLRGIYQVPNTFFRECFIDEMAYAARQDAIEYRRRLCAHDPRVVRVLDALAKRSGWGTATPPGYGRGVAMNVSANTVCAQVFEIAVNDRGAIRVHRVVSAIDPGVAVNPLTIELQTQSAVVFGLSAALYGKIDIKDGRTVQSNLHDYELLQMAEMPRVETVVLESDGTWGGVGEQPLPPVAPALCNALFAATGRRVRSLPLREQNLRSRSASAG